VDENGKAEGHIFPPLRERFGRALEWRDMQATILLIGVA
jgi:hypothetical protein